MISRAYVELGPVQRTREQVASKASFGKFRLTVRAVIDHGMQLPGHPAYNNAVLS